MTEPQTTDTFTDARGARFIAGCPVPEPVWERFQAISNTADEAVRLRLERDLWQELAEARSGILTAYRVGGRVPGKHIDAARRAERRLSELKESDRG